MEIKKNQLTPKLDVIKPDDLVELHSEETPENQLSQDHYTRIDLQNTLAQMKELQAKAQSGEIKITDQHLLDDLTHHIDELSECLVELENDISNE